MLVLGISQRRITGERNQKLLAENKPADSCPSGLLYGVSQAHGGMAANTGLASGVIFSGQRNHMFIDLLSRGPDGLAPRAPKPCTNQIKRPAFDRRATRSTAVVESRGSWRGLADPPRFRGQIFVIATLAVHWGEVNLS